MKFIIGACKPWQFYRISFLCCKCLTWALISETCIYFRDPILSEHVSDTQLDEEPSPRLPSPEAPLLSRSCLIAHFFLFHTLNPPIKSELADPKVPNLDPSKTELLALLPFPVLSPHWQPCCVAPEVRRRFQLSDKRVFFSLLMRKAAAPGGARGRVTPIAGSREAETRTEQGASLL